MLCQEDYIVIRTLKKRGVYQKEIAAELGVHPRTVSRAIQRGSAPQPQRRSRSSKLDPYKPQIDRLLAEGVWNAVVILREIQAQGYGGGSTILRGYIQPQRKQRQSKATVRFETPPGRQLQSDCAEITTEIGGEETKVCFIANTLGYSRRFHFWCTDCMDAEHTYEGVIRSFEYFGGVTEEVLVDNQKAAVLSHRSGESPRFNLRFVDLADHYGFVPRACQPYRARTKGKDERMVGYIKQHFFVRYRAFDSWAHLNQLAEQWLRQEADLRLHGTVKEVVAERFQRWGQPVLIPGDMGTASYVLLGTAGAMEQTFGSTCHGAGRVLSRQAAIKRAKGRRIDQELAAKGIIARARGRTGLAEEQPEAYKDIDAVVQCVVDAGLAKKVARLRPMGVIKG